MQATNRQFPQTVTGAYLSGLREANCLLSQRGCLTLKEGFQGATDFRTISDYKATVRSITKHLNVKRKKLESQEKAKRKRILAEKVKQEQINMNGVGIIEDTNNKDETDITLKDGIENAENIYSSADIDDVVTVDKDLIMDVNVESKSTKDEIVTQENSVVVNSESDCKQVTGVIDEEVCEKIDLNSCEKNSDEVVADVTLPDSDSIVPIMPVSAIETDYDIAPSTDVQSDDMQVDTNVTSNEEILPKSNSNDTGKVDCQQTMDTDGKWKDPEQSEASENEIIRDCEQIPTKVPVSDIETDNDIAPTDDMQLDKNVTSNEDILPGSDSNDTGKADCQQTMDTDGKWKDPEQSEASENEIIRDCEQIPTKVPVSDIETDNDIAPSDDMQVDKNVTSNEDILPGSDSNDTGKADCQQTMDTDGKWKDPEQSEASENEIIRDCEQIQNAIETGVKSESIDEQSSDVDLKEPDNTMNDVDTTGTL